jgi:hypothetical protein
MTFSISQPSINTIHSGHFSGLLRSMYLEASIKSLGVILMVWWGLSPLSTIFQLFQWRSILLVEVTGVPGENHRPVTSNWQTCSHNVVHLALIEILTHNISGDRHWLHRHSCKSNYHTITATTALKKVQVYVLETLYGTVADWKWGRQ